MKPLRDFLIWHPLAAVLPPKSTSAASAAATRSVTRESCLAAMSAARRDAHLAVVLAAEAPEPALVLMLELMAQGQALRAREGGAGAGAGARGTGSADQGPAVEKSAGGRAL